MGVTHPSREECGRELMLMFHSNSKISTLIFVLFVSVKNLETLTRTIQPAVFFFPEPPSHPPSFTVSLSLFYLAWLLPYSWPDLTPSRQVRVQEHQPRFSVCIIHDLPLLTGQLFSIQILLRFNLGSIHCPDCWPLITSEVHRCWISVGALCQSRLTNSTSINHRSTGSWPKFARLNCPEGLRGDASTAFIKVESHRMWLMRQKSGSSISQI